MNQNWLVKIGTFFIKLILKLGLPVKFLIKNTLFNQFCGGESIQDCQKTVQVLDYTTVVWLLEDQKETIETLDYHVMFSEKWLINVYYQV